MSTILRTKFFECRQYYRRTHVNDVTSWELIQEKSGMSIDKQLNKWLEQTNYQIVGLSAPGIQHYWLDENHEFKCLITGIIATYTEAPVNNDYTAPPNFGGPQGMNYDNRNNFGQQPAPPPAPAPAVNVRRPAPNIFKQPFGAG
jgi:hypothetical protein